MTAITDQISQLLHEAGETHHRVYRIVDPTSAKLVRRSAGVDGVDGLAEVVG
jgi:hypothetical protein